MNAENEEWLRTNPHTLTQSSTTDKKKPKKKKTRKCAELSAQKDASIT